MKLKVKEIPALYLILFILLVIVISVAGLYFYNYSLKQKKAEAYSSISTLTILKKDQIVKWQKERIGEAKFIQGNVHFKQLIAGHLKYPGLTEIKKNIVEWLRPIKENHEYSNISIIDTSGRLYSLFVKDDSITSRDKILYRNSVEKKEIILSGFYKNPLINRVTLRCFVPLSLPDINNGKTFAVLKLRIDPEINLYPLLKLNPISSRTAESFLVEELEDSVVFLSELRFRENSAASFKLSKKSKSLPAAMVIKGKTGLFEGVDYDGEEVLADLAKIPNSSWYIVSKINLSEVYAPVREQALYIIAGVLTLILLSGSLVYIAWKNEKIKFISRELKSEREKKDLFRNMSEGYAYCQAVFENGRVSDFIFLDVNDTFSRLTGLRNVAGKSILELIPSLKQNNPDIFNIYSRITATGKAERLELYMDFLKKWYIVSVYSPEEGYFVAILSDITQQKNALMEFKKLSSAVEQSPASVVITDLSGNIEYVNPKFTEVTGYTLEEAKGKNPNIIKSGKTPDEVYKKLWETITSGNEWKGDLLNKRKNGELYWETVSISPIKNESGIITHYVSVKEDINKRKIIEKELKASEERLRKMFEDHTAVMLMIDPESGEIIDANPAAVMFYGYAYEKLCSMKIYEINLLPRDELTAQMQRSVHKEQGYFIFQHKLADGQLRTVEVYSSPLEIRNKHLLFSIIHDITERKKIEKELNESLTLHQTLSQTIPFGMQIVDKHGNILFANRALNPSARDLYGQKCWDIYKDDKKQCRDCPLYKPVSLGTTTMLEVEGVLGGKTYQIYHTEIIYKGSNAFLEIFQDVTQRKKDQEALLASEERFSKAFSGNPNALVITRIKDGSILEVNETYLKLFGYTRSETIGKSSTALKMYAKPEDAVEAINLLKQNGKLKDYELIIRTKNGEERTALLSSEIIRIRGEESVLTILQDITERRKAEEKLRISEQQYRDLLEAQQELIVRVDMQGRFTYVNEAYSKKFGIEREGLIGKSSFKPLVYPDDLPRTLERMRQLEIPPYSVKIEQRAYTSEGLRWIEWEDTAIIDNGKIVEIQGVGRDIHERKTAEEALRRSEEQLKRAQEIAHLGSWELDLINDKLTWSDEVYRIFGLEPQEFAATYEAFLEAVHPEDRKAVDDAYSGSLRNKRDTYEIEHRIIRKATGEVRFVHEKCQHYRDENGKIIRSTGMVHDITENVETIKALRESEERFRNLADTMPQLVWTANSKGVVDYYNSRVTEFEGIVRNEDASWSWTPVLHEEDVIPTLEAWNNSLKTGNIYEIIHRVRKKDGTFKWFLSRGFPIKNQNDEVIKWYGTATDITVQKETEEQLEHTLLELKRSNKELEQFAYTASHDLQEPIRMVKSYAQIIEMKSSDKLDQKLKEYFAFIKEGAGRMQQLIDDLLKFSRITTGKKDFAGVDCNQVLKDVLEDLKFRIMSENAKIEIDNLPVIKGDRTQIRQLFQNFLQNALKFRSERDPVIKIKSEKKDSDWLFSVSDNGIGIEPQFYERIFIIFQRLHEREKYPGTGIGLAICKKIIEGHGGHVYVESELNKGTTFYFTIPADGKKGKLRNITG